MGKKVTWARSASIYFADSYKWRLENTSEKSALKFLETVVQAIERLAIYPTTGRPAASDPSVRRANVGYDLYIVYAVLEEGIHIHLMRSHRQPDEEE